jgi:CRISPR-associated protein Csd1
MILQTLNEYYGRLFEEGVVPSFGFSYEKISFELLLDSEGTLLNVNDLRNHDGKKYKSAIMEVPYTNEVNVRSSNVQPNFLVDKATYTLGNDEDTKPKRLKECHESFLTLLDNVTKNIDDKGLIAVQKFLKVWKPEDSSSLNHWEDIATGKDGFIVFRIDGKKSYVHDQTTVKQAWEKYLSCQKDDGINYSAQCLITGKRGKIQRLHTQFKNIQGGQQSGKSLVSFNKDKTAFTSYQKESSFNAPVIVEAEFASSTALKYMLGGNNQKIQIGDATTVFWTEHKSRIIEIFGTIFESKNDSEVKDIRDFLNAVRSGKKPEDIDFKDRFYILGLSPNASRLSVRFWHVSTVGEMSARVAQHFDDLAICKSYDNDPEFPGMWQLLISTVPHRKSEKPKSDSISPVLAGPLMRSILTGSAYPRSLLTVIIGRIRADRKINYIRASLIKAYLNRNWRINKKTMEVTMALNKEETSTAYRLGRLFAVLEKVQKDALGKNINSTIKDRYYGSASATPKVVFPQLLRLAQHHIQKADYGKVSDMVIEEIIQGIEKFPAHLSLDEQGLFAIGYYHQRTDFYSKSNENKEDSL